MLAMGAAEDTGKADVGMNIIGAEIRGGNDLLRRR